MPRLKVLCDYINPPWGYVLHKGEVIEVSEEEAQRLVADSPGSFKAVSEPKVKSKAVKKPTKDKMIRNAAVEKGEDDDSS